MSATCTWFAQTHLWLRGWLLYLWSCRRWFSCSLLWLKSSGQRNWSSVFGRAGREEPSLVRGVAFSRFPRHRRACPCLLFYRRRHRIWIRDWISGARWRSVGIASARSGSGRRDSRRYDSWVLNSSIIVLHHAISISPHAPEWTTHARQIYRSSPFLRGYDRLLS